MPHNDIGQKIKQLRLQRKMTQSDLAGDQITRNMLSRIENGAALPSLPTVWYLAERLEVPAGFLLAEGNDDRIWRKMNRIESIRRLLKAGDARVCMELCREEDQEKDADDEICLIMAQCALALGVETFAGGYMHQACSWLDEAVAYAGRTVYDTTAVRDTAALYFRFMHRLSPMLYSENLPQTKDPLTGSRDPFGRYVLALEALEAGEEQRIQFYLEQNQSDEWAAHFAAHYQVHKGDYRAAMDSLLELLQLERAQNTVWLYCLFCDLEICCRELGDFKGAYEYSQNKVSLLETMLQK